MRRLVIQVGQFLFRRSCLNLYPTGFKKLDKEKISMKHAGIKPKKKKQTKIKQLNKSLIRAQKQELITNQARKKVNDKHELRYCTKGRREKREKLLLMLPAALVLKQLPAVLTSCCQLCYESVVSCFSIKAAFPHGQDSESTWMSYILNFCSEPTS